MRPGLTLGIAVAILICTTSTVWSGTVHGLVRDANTSEAIIGANIRIIGTNLGTTTDLDGRFKIEGVPAGVYNLRIFYGGYAAKIVTALTVEDDPAKSVRVDLDLEPLGADTDDGAARLEDTYVTAERVRSTSAAILSERQRSAIIGDGISADQIARSPDATSSDALKRVTGISIVDNKYVFVRGVTDRYNGTTLNGVTVTSTDTKVDKKSFSFDLVPAELLSNTIVVKTSTPDLPGDFSGGLVQLNTLDFPARPLVAVKVGAGSDNHSNDAERLLGPRGADDWKGQDDGTRARPQVGGTSGTNNELAKALNNNWALGTENAPYNGNFGLALGNRHGLGAAREVGYIGSLMYRRGYRTEEYTQRPGEVSDNRTEDGTRYEMKVLWGGLVNVTFKPWRDHKISLRNNYSRSADENLSQGHGDLRGEIGSEGRGGKLEEEQTIEWNERWMYLGQVAGQHEFDGLGGLKFNWQYHYNESEAAEPDRKYVRYSPDTEGRLTMKENHRSWSDLAEIARGAGADLEYPIASASVKAGYLVSERERTFSTEDWVTNPWSVRGQRPPWFSAVSALPLDTIFHPDNYQERYWRFDSFGDFTGQYDARHDLTAWYAMGDIPFSVRSPRFRVAGGARVEDSFQEVNSTNPDGTASAGNDVVKAVVENRDVLPSANFTWMVTRAANLRIGYSESVNRPEFRELSPVKYYDFNRERNVQGNPGLRRAEIRSYDVRLEWFPGLDEVLSVSLFRKDITDAIEERLLPAPDRYVQTWENAPNADNRGWELEARKSFSFLGSYLSNLILAGNYTRVTSVVEYIDYQRPAPNEPFEPVTLERPMQGQSPWMANLSLMFNEPDIGLNASLLFNKSGRRLASVGETRNEDVYEEPRAVLDLSLTQDIGRWSKLKFTVRDILAEDLVYTIGEDRAIDEAVQRSTVYSLSLSFNL